MEVFYTCGYLIKQQIINLFSKLPLDPIFIKESCYQNENFYKTKRVSSIEYIKTIVCNTCSKLFKFIDIVIGKNDSLLQYYMQFFDL